MGEVKFTFGSLFAGIGGIDLGLERAGMLCKWQVENDGFCQQVLRRHWPGVPKFGDVRDVGRNELETVDLIAGGFPCQDVSVAGNRAGLDGERSGLFYEFMRVVGELTPRWVLIENVPGLLSSNNGRDMATVVGSLAEFGYGWAYRVLDAQYFGVPQRRRRVFIVGYLGDARRATEVLFEPESCSGDSPPSREEGERIADPITKSFAKHRGAGGGKDSTLRNAVMVFSRGNLGRPAGANPTTSTSPTIRADMGDHFPTIFYQCQGSNVGPMGELRRGNGHVTGGVPFVSPTLCSHYDLLAVSENQRAEVRLTPYSRQLTTGGGKPGQGYPAVMDDMMVRRLTPTECERLQGFPDNWTAFGVQDGEYIEISDTRRYKQLGNAVCVPVAEWIGQRVMGIERG